MADEVQLSELEELRSFLAEALVRADSTTDTSPGSVYDTEVITPMIKRYTPDPFDTPIRDFILKRLASEYPDLVIQEGDPIDDYLVKLAQVLLEPYRRQIKLVSQNQSFEDPSVLTEDAADKLGANFFVSRRQGGFSVGIARLYFTTPQAVLVTPSNPCVSSGGLKFLPIENQALDMETMRLNVEGNLYYFDIVVRSEQKGSSYNIEPDELVSIDGLTSVVQVTNKNQFEEGADREDNETYAARVEESLSEKSLVTSRGINAKLLDVFQNIKNIATIGYGDPEMERDIIEAGVKYETYGQFTADGVNGSTLLTAPAASDVTDGDPAHEGFIDVGAAVGDKIVFYRRIPAVEKIEYTVTRVINATQIQVEPALTAVIADTDGTFSLQRQDSTVVLSDIPGGILVPDTVNGTVTLNSNEIHIGGMYDVFVRAGFPQERSTTLETIRDAEPLHFGVDLESFDEGDDRFVSLFYRSTAAYVETNGDNFVFVQERSSTELFWWPESSDVDRYIQLVSGSLVHIFKITSIDERVWYGAPLNQYAWKVSFDDSSDYAKKEAGGVAAGGTEPAAGTYAWRLMERISINNIVRDRDNSRDPAGADFDALGVEIGDSVVIETGDDADIYTIRQILTSLDTNDSLVLSRELTTKVKPSGEGDGSGLRYRVADELDVDLVEPKTTKLPLGNVFPGGDLNAFAGSLTVTAGSTTDFSLAGIIAGDTLRILEGDNAGDYVIEGVTSSALTVDTAMPSTAFNQSYQVFTSYTPIERPLVRVRNIELLDSSLQPTGITVPYGDVIDARLTGTLSNRAQGVLVEEYTGQTKYGGNVEQFRDINVNWAARGVTPGSRLVVYDEENQGEYIITAVDSPSSGILTIVPEADGGTDFITEKSSVHYHVGVASTGYVRLYFLEPTSVQLRTGIDGARLNYEEGDLVNEFIFSEVDGYTVLPAGGSEDDNPRDIKVVNSISIPGPAYRTILEFTDTNNPDMYDLEVEVGDVIEVNEQIYWRDVSGDSLVDEGSGGITIWSGFPLIHTVAGSNIVKVSPTSNVSFDQMDILGHLFYIDEGPDEGIYTIEEQLGADVNGFYHELRLSAPMTATTETIRGYDLNTPGNGNLFDDGGVAKLVDALNNPGASQAEAGQYITIYEVTDDDHQAVAGTWEISEVVSASEVKLTGCPVASFAASSTGTGKFRWFRTVEQDDVGHLFRIYNAAPTQVQVIEVAAAEDEKVSGVGDIVLSGPDVVRVNGSFVDVEVGDQIEITYSPSGVNTEVRTITAVDAGDTYVLVATTDPFPNVEASVSYRVWGGIRGSRRMVTVEGYQGSDGRIDYGVMMPYAIRRGGIYRISSTEMEDNFDGSLYYTDVQVESLGSGDSLNLLEDTRMIVASGISVDGYTYSVENNVLTFSPYEQVNLRFDRRFLPVGNSDLPENLAEVSGRNLSINYDLSSTARVVDDLLRSESERAVNANPIARHFLPAYLLTTLTYRGGSSANLVGDEIENYVNSLGGSELEVSDLERLITRRGANSVEHPIELVTVTHDLNRRLVVDRSDNSLGVGEVPYEGTARITSFFAYLNEGLYVIKES